MHEQVVLVRVQAIEALRVVQATAQAVVQVRLVRPQQVDQVMAGRLTSV